MFQPPSIGRVVHYQSYNENGECSYAAIITQINSEVKGVPGDHGSDRQETVELVTFGPNSVYFQHKVPFSEQPKPSHWSWPPRV